MKISKRLLAVLMAVVMILTIVPLGLFVFAEGEEPEPQDPPKPGSAENPIIIHNYSELQAVMNGLATPTEETPEPTYPINGYYKLDAEGTFNSDAALVEWLEVHGEDVAEDLNIASRHHDATYEKATVYEAGITYYTDNTGTTEFDVDGYVTPENYSDFFVNAGTEEVPEYVAATEYSKDLKYFNEDGTVEYTAIDNETFYAKTADAYWEAAQITDLSPEQKAKLIADNNLEFVYTTPIKTFKGILDGNGVVLSNLKIVSAKNESTIYAGLVATSSNQATFKDLTFDNTCSISVDASSETKIKVLVGTCVAYAISCNFENIVSNAIISAISNIDGCAVNVGGVVGYSMLCKATNITFGGSIDYKYASTAFDSPATLESISKNTNINLGGYSGFGFDTSLTDPMTCTGIISTTFRGPTVNVGKTVAIKNDYKLDPTMTTTDFTYPSSTNGWQKNDVFGAPQTENAPDENGYQLIKATKDGITYAYIRTETCAHETTSVSLIDNTDTMCPSFGVVKYYKCNDCEKCFEDEACTTEIALSAISNKGHTWSDWETVTPATFTAVGSETRHCTNEGCTAEETREIPVVSTEIQLAESHGTYKIDSGLLVTSFPLTTEGLLVSDLLKNLISLPEGANYVVKDSEGNVLTTSDTISTGCKVYISGYEGNALTIAVRGDVDGDGAVGIGDYIDIRNEIMGTFVIEGDAKRAAADTDNDGKQANIGDYVDIRNLIMSMSK